VLPGFIYGKLADGFSVTRVCGWRQHTRAPVCAALDRVTVNPKLVVLQAVSLPEPPSSASLAPRTSPHAAVLGMILMNGRKK